MLEETTWARPTRGRPTSLAYISDDWRSKSPRDAKNDASENAAATSTPRRLRFPRRRRPQVCHRRPMLAAMFVTASCPTIQPGVRALTRDREYLSNISKVGANPLYQAGVLAANHVLALVEEGKWTCMRSSPMGMWCSGAQSL